MDNLDSQLKLINYQLFSLNNALYSNYDESFEMYVALNIDYYGNNKDEESYNLNNLGIDTDWLDYFSESGEYRNLIDYPSNEEIDNIVSIIKENDILKFDTIDYQKLDESLLNFGTNNNENLQEVFKDIEVLQEVKVDNKEIIEVIEKGNKTTNLLLSILIGALVITTFFKNIFR